MAQIRGYVDLREHQLWNYVAREIVEEGMRPVTAELALNLQHVVANEQQGDVVFLSKTIEEIEAEKQIIARLRRHAPEDNAKRTKMVPSRPSVRALRLPPLYVCNALNMYPMTWHTLSFQTRRRVLAHA